jgi:hypothetical protein
VSVARLRASTFGPWAHGVVPVRSRRLRGAGRRGIRFRRFPDREARC